MYYFSREDSGDYRRLLLDFGISQEEWKNIIAKMNNDEGGIDELFDRCSTSDSVFNEWIIKNIEKVQLAGEAGGTEIQELLAALVGDTIKNEEYLKAQKIISDYMERHHQLEDGLEGVCRSLEELDQAEKRLGGMFQALKKREAQAEREGLELEVRRQELKEAELQIQREEASEQYYEVEAQFQECVILTQKKRKEQEEISRRLQEGRFQLECCQAAKILEECRRLQGKIEGIRGTIEAHKGDRDGKERMDNLAYSLSIWCREECRRLEDGVRTLEEDTRELQEGRKRLGLQEGEKEEEQNRQNKKVGILEAETERFDRYETGVFQELGVSFLRNMLKELDKAGVETFEKNLKNQALREEGRLELLFGRAEEIDIRCAELAGLLLQHDKKIYETEHGQKMLEAEMERFTSWNAHAHELFLKYEIPEMFLYDERQIAELLESKIRQQEGQRYQLLSEEKQISDMLGGIRNHRVYIPETLLNLIEQQDITYQTGESYLGNLDEGRRKLQLLKNPLLPFGLILRHADKKKLEEVTFEECLLRQAVPVFTYEQLNHEYLAVCQIVEIGDEIGVISSYEERIFADEPRKEYVKQLEAKKAELVEFIRHREEELGQLRDAAGYFQEIPYDRNSGRELESRLEEIGAAIERLEKEKKDWNWELDSLGQEKLQNGALREHAEKTLSGIGKKKEVLAEYLRRNEAYQEHYQNLCGTRVELQNTKQALVKIRKDLEENHKKTAETRESAIRMKYHLDQVKDVAVRYRDAKPAVLLEESFSQMEEEYRQLAERFHESLNVLTKELEEKNREYETCLSELSELSVGKEDYEDVVFEREKVVAKKAEIRELEEEEKAAYGEVSRLENRQGTAKARWETAQRQLKELGLAGPLSKSEVKQDYDRRRKMSAAALRELAAAQTGVEKIRSHCLEIAGRIEDMDVPLDSRQGCVLAEDMRAQFQELREVLKKTRNSALAARKSCNSLYLEVSREFKGKNQCVTDILESLKQISFEEGTLTYETVYFSMEEFIKKRESLHKLLDFYSGQLESIVHTKKQIVDQCISYARMIYEDVKLIVRKSRVQMSGRNRPVQMLKVGIPEELDTEVRTRMTQHIDESLRILTELGKSENIPEKKWKEKLSLFMSSRELFNQLIGTNKVPVYVYKIDLSEKGSGLKRWEDAMIQNSGGEKFVAFFTMISTLISYIRDVGRQNAGGDAIQERKVLIMDNPFARTSSEHLLKAVMDIARTFKIQLICLSDLSQSSITNRFSLIYQLSIRKRMYSDKEVLKPGPVRINKAGVEKNERLEHIGVYEMGVQRSLWELMKDV